MTRQPRRSAFTLVELLAVIGIIAILISILMPALRKARQQANLITCQSNLRQLYTFALMYTNDNNGLLPIGADWWQYDVDDVAGRQALGYRDLRRLPYYANGRFGRLPGDLWSRISRCPESREPDPNVDAHSIGSYGINGYTEFGRPTNSTFPRPVRITSVKPAADKMFFGDTGLRDNLGGAPRWSFQNGRYLGDYTYNGRHGNKLPDPNSPTAGLDMTGRTANVVFFDGHVEFKGRDWFIQWPLWNPANTRLLPGDL